MKLEITRPLLKMAWLTPLLCCFAVAQQSANADLIAVVQGMEKAQTEQQGHSPYQVIREYRLFGAKSSSANADVVAQVDFKPPSTKGYNIQKWSGSSRGKQIVQRVLDHEMEASKGNQARTALTNDNYDFILIGETVLDGRPCYVLGLKPKRKERELISGAAWVDKRSYFILHIEGETARSAVADVRLLGSHTLTSRILDYRGIDMSASTTLAPTRIQLRSQDPRH